MGREMWPSSIDNGCRYKHDILATKSESYKLPLEKSPPSCYTEGAPYAPAGGATVLGILFEEAEIVKKINGLRASQAIISPSS
jgi:hypothetical protein